MADVFSCTNNFLSGKIIAFPPFSIHLTDLSAIVRFGI